VQRDRIEKKRGDRIRHEPIKRRKNEGKVRMQLIV
jgi:hypothetical protein